MGDVVPLHGERPVYRAKIVIAIPTHDMTPAMFAYDLASLVMHTGREVENDRASLDAQGVGLEVTLGIEVSKGTYVHSARQELINEALRNGATHILWLDSDMRFPPDALGRLFNHNLPMVGINYAKRKVPTDFVAIKTVGWEPGDRSAKLITDENSTGLEEVEAVGFGMVLMQTAALKAMPDPKKEPWFWFKWIEEKQQQVGEDVWFCKLFRDSGQRIFVDHDLSRQCSHIGQFDYRCDHVLLTKPEAVAV